MVRRSFRRGLRLGLLVGVLFAVVKMLKTYRAGEEPPAHAPSPSPWPPPRPTPAATPAPATTSVPAVPTIEEIAETLPAGPHTGPGGEVAESAPRQRPLRAAEPSTRPPAKRAAAKKAAPARVWVEPSGTVCPPSHPIKAKLSSKLFHLPGMLAYDRCKPDRCYAEEAAAVADGLQKAKR